MKMKACLCESSGIYFYGLLAIQSKKKICQIVEEVWTITEQVVKRKDLRRQTKEWMAVFSQTVWEILSKKL